MKIHWQPAILLLSITSGFSIVYSFAASDEATLLGSYSEEQLRAVSALQEADASESVPSLFDEYQMAYWDRSSSEDLRMVVSLPEAFAEVHPSSSRQVLVQYRMLLGPHSVDWNEEPFEMRPGETQYVSVLPPVGEFDEEMTSTYSAQISAYVAIGEERGSLGTVYLVWPNGQDEEMVFSFEPASTQLSPEDEALIAGIVLDGCLSPIYFPAPLAHRVAHRGTHDSDSDY